LGLFALKDDHSADWRRLRTDLEGSKPPLRCGALAKSFGYTPDTQTQAGLKAESSEKSGNSGFPQVCLVGGNGLEPLTLSV
jgi:hypothetical protein